MGNEHTWEQLQKTAIIRDRREKSIYAPGEVGGQSLWDKVWVAMYYSFARAGVLEDLHLHTQEL